ncbi:hypothetical protein E3P99_01176 [Wallemia hederae]|uniref:Uncharacterized protein n=1 Tax=Wallemia hederae TaxID=1540922 RepID=A0A4T0FW75_9BASI|nr:hypothetical protein E3P99_01176 [Wallemia hederae]
MEPQSNNTASPKRKRKLPVIDLTASDTEEAPEPSTSIRPPTPPRPQTSKEAKPRKRTRDGTSSKSSTPSVYSSRSSSVVSTQQQKGKKVPFSGFEDDDKAHDNVDGFPVLNEHQCPICYDLITNYCITACVGRSSTLHPHLIQYRATQAAEHASSTTSRTNGSRTKPCREQIPNDVTFLTPSSPTPAIRAERQKFRRSVSKAAARTDYAARIYKESNLPDHTFEGPCPLCRKELSGGWGEAIIPLYLRTVENLD